MTPLFEPLLQPIGILWSIHVFAALWMARRKKWREAFFCAAIAVAIFSIGGTSIPTRLLATLERPYVNQNPKSLPAADAIVMLGGVLVPSRSDVFGFDLGEGADRAVTACELFKEKKAGMMILGGNGGRLRPPSATTWSEGELLKPWLASWGVTGTNIFQLHTCQNTREEAVEVAAIIQQKKWHRIILVTSAYHMKRASGLFSRLGIQFETVACDFIGLSFLENQKRLSLFPTANGFHHLELYLHEKIGWLYYRLRGWVGGDLAS